MTSKCPYCDYTTPEEKVPRIMAQWEVIHMQTEHPEIIAERLEEAGFHPDEFKPPKRNWSSALDHVPVNRILLTVRALRGANKMANEIAEGNRDPSMKGYVAGHDEVCDAIEAYCAERVTWEATHGA